MNAKPMWELSIDRAAMFTNSKGRMPWDVHELREWLREFAEFETKCLEATEAAYKEHMATCNQAIIIQAPPPAQSGKETP